MIATYLAVAALAASPSVERFGLVVGNNLPLPGSDYEALQFADDDAIRVARYLEGLGAHVELLTTPDAETTKRFGDQAARPPSRRELRAALARLRAKLEAAEGKHREVWVYFSGHGSVNSSSAYLHLTDGKLTRTDVHGLILEQLPRERMHVIIDSCHSYFLVNARGNRLRVPAGEETSLERHPDVGFLLSTSDRREVHEWQGFQAGVFSYQVLGALQGAADIDGNGKVSYAEAHAYVAAANMAVENPRARVHPFIRRPTGEASPTLIDLRDVTDDKLVVVPAKMHGKLRLLDLHGYPLLDANKPAGQRLRLVAPANPILVVAGRRYRPAQGMGTARILSEEDTSGIVASRGTIDEDFRRNLFSRPLTADFLAGLEAALQDGLQIESAPIVTRRTWTEDPVTWSLLGTGVAAAVAGGVFAGLAEHQASIANESLVNQEVIDAGREGQVYRLSMGIGFGLGAALIGGAVLHAISVEGQPVDEPTLEAFAAPTEGGFHAAIGGRF